MIARKIFQYFSFESLSFEELLCLQTGFTCSNNINFVIFLCSCALFCFSLRCLQTRHNKEIHKSELLSASEEISTVRGVKQLILSQFALYTT